MNPAQIDEMFDLLRQILARLELRPTCRVLPPVEVSVKVDATPRLPGETGPR